MYNLLNHALDHIESSLKTIERERQDKEYKNGAGVLPQQLYQLSIAFQNMRKEERETAKMPLPTDTMSPEQLLDTIAEVFTEEEIATLLERKRGEPKDEQEETDSEGRE